MRDCRNDFQQIKPRPDWTVTGPRGTLAVGEGGRDNTVGWVVYVPDEPGIGDTVVQSRRLAQAIARERVGADPEPGDAERLARW
jgi:hypothetical protein